MQERTFLSELYTTWAWIALAYRPSAAVVYPDAAAIVFHPTGGER